MHLQVGPFHLFISLLNCLIFSMLLRVLSRSFHSLRPRYVKEFDSFKSGTYRGNIILDLDRVFTLKRSRTIYNLPSVSGQKIYKSKRPIVLQQASHIWRGTCSIFRIPEFVSSVFCLKPESLLLSEVNKCRCQKRVLQSDSCPV